MAETVRIDKYLWAIRVYKTRSIATEACKKGHVLMDEKQVKPSRVIKVGDTIQVKKLPVIYSYRVKGLLEKRQSAKIAAEYYEDITPQEELDKMEVKETFFVKRDRGAGRPTKKERRTLDKLQGWDDL